MAIVSVDEKKGVRRGALNMMYQRVFTRVYQIVTDDPATDAKTVLFAAGLPTIGNTYLANGVRDRGAFVQSVEVAEESEDGRQWRATVEYGPLDTSLFGTNPLLWPIKVRYSHQKYEKVVWADQAGNAILNSAFDPFKDPVTIDDSRAVITVIKNYAVSGWNDQFADAYRDTVNLSLWNGFAAGLVKCGAIDSGEEQYDSNQQQWYYAATFVFETNRDGWFKYVLDQGFNELDSSSPPRQRPMTDTSGQPLSEAMPLDGTGRRLATTGVPVFLTANVYPTSNFNDFGMNFATALGR